MKRLTILVDMDDTVEDLLGAWVSYLNTRYGTSVQKDEVTQWDISQAFHTLDKAQVYEPLYLDSFWCSVKPIDGASETLQKLMADGHRVLIVTTSAYQTLHTKMEEVLFRYFPFLTWDDVIVTSHKQLVNGDVLVDDGTHNLEGGDYLRILMDAPHNRAYNAEKNGMTRVYNWDDAYDVISHYARSYKEEVDIAV